MSHSDLIKDADGFFEVDATTRQIINKTPSKIVLMQHDHNSEKFTFMLPRYIEGHDMSETARAVVHYINIENLTGNRSEDSYRFYDLQINPDDDSTVICSWLISGNATMYAGQLTFLVEFDCYDEDNALVYSWHSAAYKGIVIGETFECDEAEHYTQYADIVAQWEQMLFEANEDGVTNITEAKADALESIASAKAEAVEEIESKTSYSVDDDGNASFYKDVRSTDNASIVHSLNDAANGIINKSEGTSLYLPDSAESALVDLSIDGEYSKICVCGNNLLNPLAITCSHLIYSETEPNMKRASTKNDAGMSINSINYDNSIGIIATQEDTKADNKTALSDLTGGYFFIYFDTPSPCYKFNKKYTFIADIEVTENKHPEQSMSMIIRGAATPNTDVTLTGTTSKICVTVTASQSADSPHRRCIQVITRGKSIIMKNIMWLEGNHKSNPPDYEDYKGQEISNVDNYKSIHTYYPITRIINDTDANMSVKYVADTKNYIDNKVADTKNYIDNKFAELQKTMNATT